MKKREPCGEAWAVKVHDDRDELIQALGAALEASANYIARTAGLDPNAPMPRELVPVWHHLLDTTDTARATLERMRGK